MKPGRSPRPVFFLAAHRRSSDPPGMKPGRPSRPVFFLVAHRRASDPPGMKTGRLPRPVFLPDHLLGHAGCGRFRFKPLPGDVRIARAAELRDHALDTQSQLVGPPERLASPECAVAKPRAACRAVQAVSRAWLFVDAEPWRLGSSAQRRRSPA